MSDSTVLKDGNTSGSNPVSRRSFLAAAGAVAGAAGVLAASEKAFASGPASNYLPGSLVKSTIKRVDKFPHELGGVQRFREVLNAFGNPPGYAEFKKDYPPTTMQKMQDKVPGFTLVDQALYNAAWTSYRGAPSLFSWEPLGVAKPVPQIGRWEGTPEEANIIIKKAARIFGAADAGVARTNPLWFYATVGRDKETPIEFTDQVTSPVKTPDLIQIPNSMQSVVVLIIPMDLQMMQFTPSALGSAAVGVGYSGMIEVASKLSEFIRGLGYQAIPMGNDTALSVPMAIEAGLGEQGRAGILVHPVLGTCLRISKVLTDLPIAPDKPIRFGVQEFCKSCKKCARECPAEAIPMDDDYNEPIRVSNNPGPKKWYVDVWKCHCFWSTNGAPCGTCQRTCPYNKPQTWMHDLVKGFTATTSVLDPVFIKLDDLMGYGTYYDPDAAARFWKEAAWPTQG